MIIQKAVLFDTRTFSGGWSAVGKAWQDNARQCHGCDFLSRFEGAPGEPLTSCGLNAGTGHFTDCPAYRAKQETNEDDECKTSL